MARAEKAEAAASLLADECMKTCEMAFHDGTSSVSAMANVLEDRTHLRERCSALEDALADQLDCYEASFIGTGGNQTTFNSFLTTKEARALLLRSSSEDMQKVKPPYADLLPRSLNHDLHAICFYPPEDADPKPAPDAQPKEEWAVRGRKDVHYLSDHEGVPWSYDNERSAWARALMYDGDVVPYPHEKAPK